MRSRAVRRPLPCWFSMALPPPPWRIFSSSLRTRATRSAIARMFFSKRDEVASRRVCSRFSAADWDAGGRLAMRRESVCGNRPRYNSRATRRKQLTRTNQNAYRLLRAAQVGNQFCQRLAELHRRIGTQAPRMQRLHDAAHLIPGITAAQVIELGAALRSGIDSRPRSAAGKGHTVSRDDVDVLQRRALHATRAAGIVSFHQARHLVAKKLAHALVG